MNFSNPYFSYLILASLGLLLLDIILECLNLKSLRTSPPDALKDIYNAQEYQRSQAYHREQTKFGILQQIITSGILIAFWLLGGFAALETWLVDLTDSPLLQGLAFAGVLFLAQSIISLPFDLYDTFHIEAKYGFNRTTSKTFIADQIKGLLLAAIIGLPLCAALLWIFIHIEQAWLYAWIFMTAFSLLLTYIAPKYLFPLFNTFSPLENQSLQDKLKDLTTRTGFPVQEIHSIDGSKRSSKANAFFSGFGKHKMIALYDTLLKDQNEEEISAVVAHEIGHYKLKHIHKQLLTGILSSAVIFYLFSLLSQQSALYQAFGVETPSTHFGFLFFFIFMSPLFRLKSIIASRQSRKNEYEADDFAAQHSNARDLISSLIKLSQKSLTNLTPHPWYVFMHYSHPPLQARLRALQKLETPAS